MKNLKLFFVMTLTVLAACWQFIPQALAGEKQPLEQIGVQLYTLRTEAPNGVDAMLKKISDMGYQQVELHTLYDMRASDLKKLLDKHNLTAPSTHRGFDSIKNDVDGAIADAKALELELVIVPWLDIKKYDTGEKWAAFSRELNEIGKKMKKQGVQLAYHNHDFEFKPLADGAVPYEVLLKNTQPEYVALQMDLFWTVKAGKDPLAYIKAHPGRIVSCHVKDMTKEGEMTEVGNGVIDFAAIFEAGSKSGLKYFIVEHDKPADPFASVKSSINYLKKMKF